MLTTLERLKQIMPEINPLDLEFFAKAASSNIVKYLNRPLEQKSITEWIAGNKNSKFLNVKLYPLLDVTSVLVDSQPTADYKIVAESGRLYREQGWIEGFQRIEITYTGGYILPGKDGVNLPEEIELACILHIQDLMRTPGVTSERVGDISVTYAPESMSNAVKSLLDGHRRFM